MTAAWASAAGHQSSAPPGDPRNHHVRVRFYEGCRQAWNITGWHGRAREAK